MKHTPPYIAEKDFVYALNNEGTNYFWASVQSVKRNNEASKEECEAIAQLFAASPELLEACKEALSFYLCMKGEAPKKLRQAIAKATGRLEEEE